MKRMLICNKRDRGKKKTKTKNKQKGSNHRCIIYGSRSLKGLSICLKDKSEPRCLINTFSFVRDIDFSDAPLKDVPD